MQEKRSILFRGLSVLVLLLGFMQSAPANAVDPVCPDASHLVGGLCVTDSTSITPLSSSSSENCPTPVAGQTVTLNSSTHLCALSQVSSSAILGTSYYCPSGGSLDSSTPPHCVTQQVSHVPGNTQSFYCPSGTPTASGVSGILDTCVTQVVASSVPATTTPTYQCNYGGYQATRGGVVYCITADEVDSVPVVVSTPTCPTDSTLSYNGFCNSYSVGHYPSVIKDYYSCPSGQRLVGSWCQVSFSFSTPATISASEYTCPSGGVPDGVNTPPLCNTTSLVSSVPPTLIDVTSCNTGSLTGSKCVVTAETKYSALGSVGYAPCGSPAQNIAGNCVVYRSVTAAASVSDGYGCGTGTPSGSGSSMICITTPYVNVVASVVNNYTCPSGGTLSGTICITTYASSYGATLSYSDPMLFGYNACQLRWGLSGSPAVALINTSTSKYDCTNGFNSFVFGYTMTSYPGSLVNVTYTPYTISVNSAYTCPSGGSLSGSTCNISQASYTATYTSSYYCPSGTPSGSGSSMICITTQASSVASVVVYLGTCATGYALNTVTGFCDSTAVSLGVPVIPTGSYYCSQRDAGSISPTYSVLPYDGSAYNGTSLRTCSLIPPPGFAMQIPDGANAFLSSYMCELFKVDPKSGLQTTLDYPSDTDNSGQDASGLGYVTCTLVFQDVTASSTADGSGDGTPPVDGSGDTTGYINAVQSCFTTTDPSDIVALSACLNNA